MRLGTNCGKLYVVKVLGGNTKVKLPVEFVEKMKNLLGDEYKEFEASFDKERYFGLRVNTLKISVEDFLKISPFELTPVAWTRDGFYYKKGESPGKDPYYYAGLYYIQEPSAMLPGSVIDAKPGEKILDLCAAPGGKSVQILAGQKGEGLLVSNDVNFKRVKALVKNVELVGATNVVVTNETPDRLAQYFPEYFDKILVDAPCSGEGMFRKDEDAIRSFSKYKNQECSNLQIEILRSAHKMLKNGGNIVYSTCTFDPLENEMIIDKFTKEYPEYDIIKIDTVDGIQKARKDFCNSSKDIENAVRLWPHKLKGEGHFVALLKKGQETLKRDVATKNTTRYVNLNKKQIEAFLDFQEKNLNITLECNFVLKGNSLYKIHYELPNLEGLKVAKHGWYLGDIKNNKFEPSNSLIISLKKDDINNIVSFSYNSDELIRYLKGETLLRDDKNNGYVGILLDGITLGWAKQQDYILKNLYPKGWRKIK